MNQAFRYELDPTNKQRTQLARHAGVSRFAYNWGLARRIEAYQATGKSPNAIAQHKELNALKAEEFPWMYEVSKCAAQEALRDLDRAYANFFKGRTRFPRFKKKGKSRDTFRLTGVIALKVKAAQLPRLGTLRLKESTAKFQGRILSAAVSREADRWYVVLAVETERVIPEPREGRPVGIDLGLKSFAVISDEEAPVLAPKPLKTGLRKLQRLSKAHSRKQKGSANRRKSAAKLADHHRRVANARKDFLHKLTTRLAKTKAVIVVEDLKVRNLIKNRSLARHIADAGWGEFRRQLEYKCQWYGSQLRVAPTFEPTSKRCSGCGAIKSTLSLSERTYGCDSCGLIIDRDRNAALNLEQLVAASWTETQNACGEAVRPSRARQVSAKQEPDSNLGVKDA